MNVGIKELWVVVETDEAGNARRGSLELLTPGRQLALRQGGLLAAVVIGGRTAAATAVRPAPAPRPVPSAVAAAMS